jgi:hypothetical protein
VVEKIGVVWPRGRKTTGGAHLAKRPATLAGKTIGEFWDYVFRGDQIFPIIEKELSKRFPGIKFVNYEVFGNTHWAHEQDVLNAFPGKFKEHPVDAIISGMGC